MKIQSALLLTSAITVLGLRVSASPHEVFSITNGWKATYSAAITERPADAAWGVYPSHGRNPTWSSIDFSKTEAKPEGDSGSYNGMWLETTVTLPAEWAGRRVHFELPVPIRRCDGVVFLNGKRVGDILRPGGSVELTGLVTPGEEATLTVFLTKDGVGTERGETRVNRWDNGLAGGLMFFPQLRATDAAYVSDVFANPSVQKKTLTLEMEVDSASAMPATLEARIFDPSGALVKTFTEAVALQPGINTYKPVQEWADPHYWDFGDGYLYRCEVKLTAATVEDAYEPFTFGFRELWRDGKELYMNGRVLHFRPTYPLGATTERAMQFMQDIGYQALMFSHEMNGFPNSVLSNPDLLENADKTGMGIILSSGALLGIADDSLPHSEPMQETFRQYVQHFHRAYRNHPCLVASYMSQMIICNIADFAPDRIGQTVGEAGRDQVINKAREIHREFNPNILYYSHADGPNGDLSSGNLYFNWTPQQEMDEWLSEWKTKGVYPWHGAEFDVPYGGSWWYGGGFGGTEYMAAQFGERAYEEEPLCLLDSITELSASNGSSHGGSSKTFSMHTTWPLYWEWRKGAVQGIARHWRGDGINGGLLWFNLNPAYGAPTNGLAQRPNTGFKAYNSIPDDYERGKKPGWALPSYDIYKAIMSDFCGYLAGAPAQADKTHSFYAGERIEKQAAFVWDGHEKKTFTAEWKAVLEGKSLASGRFEREMKPGEIAFEAFGFEAPAVTEKKTGQIQLTFSDGSEHTFAFEVYPKAAKAWNARTARLAVYDPEGRDAAMLEALGVTFTRLESLSELGDATHLVVGRKALNRSNLDVTTAQLQAGLKVLVMPQSPVVWQSLGFEVQDAMSRNVFVRTGKDGAFAGITDDMLQYWRGSPNLDVPEYQRVMDHAAQRGPVGTRRHVVAGLLLQVPETAGYIPLMDGGYDLNYAALMRLECGKGALTTCTLELEDRVGIDPAATEVARAVMADFVGYDGDVAKRIVCDGAAAQAFAATLGLAVADEGEIVLAGPDATQDWATLSAKAEAGATVFVYANEALAKAAGFGVEARQLYRVKRDESAMFRGFTPSLLRWRDALEVGVLTGEAVAGAKVLCEGLFAEVPMGAGRVVFCQVDPTQLAERYATVADAELITADRTWLLNFARVAMEELGAPKADDENPKAGRSPSRAWYYDGSQQIIDECGVSRSGRTGNIIVAGIDHSMITWEAVRNWADKGHNVLVVNNVRVAQTAGFEVGPRERVNALDGTAFGEAFASLGSRTFAETRSVHRLLKAPEGFTISADGLKAEGTIGESRVTFLMINAMEHDKAVQDAGRVKRMRESNDISSERVRQMFARILTNLGAMPAETHVARALHVAPLNPFAPLPAAHVLGPYNTGKDDGDYMLTNVFDAVVEKMTLEGDFNPNIDFALPQGGTANWRPMLAPESTGLYDFQKLYPDTSFPVTYSIVHVNRREADKAMLKIGVDWRCVIWCNGKEVFRTGFGAHFPKYEVELDLEKGDNVLSFKVGSGRAGNKLWALLTSEPDPNAATRVEKPELDEVKLYAPNREDRDPYRYVYW